MQYSAAITRLALIAAPLVAMPRFGRADQPVNILLNGGAEEVASIVGKGSAEARDAQQGAAPGRIQPDWYPVSRPAPELRMWLDRGHARTGQVCLAIANDHQYPHAVSNNWAQKLRYIPTGKTVRLTGYIRTESAEAANICVQCWGPDGERMIAFSSTPVFRGTHEWTFAQAPDVVVPPATTSLVVRAALTGKGQAYFDDLSLQIVGEPVAGDRDLEGKVPGRVLRTLPVTKDCTVASYIPQWDHGDVDNLAVGDYNGGVRTLLAWQPPTPEETSRPGLRFLLAIYCRESRCAAPRQPLQMHEVLEDWKETTCWDTQPRFAATPSGTFNISPDTGWKILDVTPVIRASARDSTHSQAGKEHAAWGVVLRFADEHRELDPQSSCDCGFVSREGIGQWENRRPVLLVVDPSQAPATHPAETRPADAPAAMPSAALPERRIPRRASRTSH